MKVIAAALRRRAERRSRMAAVSQACGNQYHDTRRTTACRRPVWRKTPPRKLPYRRNSSRSIRSHEAARWVEEQLLAAYLKANQADKALAMGDQLAALPPECVEDAQATLKAAEMKKDPDLVLKWSAKTSELAQKVVASPQPKEADEVENWKARVDYARQVNTYTEYSLYAMALQTADAQKQVALIEALQQRNPKSEYLPKATDALFVAYQKSGATDKAVAFAQQVAATGHAQRRYAAGPHRRCRQEEGRREGAHV